MLTVEAPDTAAPVLAEGTKWVIPQLLVVAGLFMAILDVTIVNVAVPAIQYEFGGSLRDVLWIATAYTLVLGVAVPLSSWLGDRIGLTRLFILALIGFALGSGLCGLAWNLDALIAFRILQAVPGGILPVATLTLTYRLVPTKNIGLAMGLYGLGAVAAPAVGPVLGGYLVEYINWRLVFDINIPLGLLTALAAWLIIPKVAKVAVNRFDFAGFATIAAAMFAILLAASESGHWGWSSYRIRLLFVCGALLLALFVVIELQVPHPLLQVRLLVNRQFTSSIICTSMFFINLLVGVFYVPVFLQQGQGMGAFAAGLLTLPSAIVTCLAIPVSGLLYQKMGPYLLGVFGILELAAGDYLLSNLTPDTTRYDVILWTCIRGLGLGFGAIPIMTYGVSAVPATQTNHASAISNVTQQIGGALALAALGTMITAQQAQLIADRSSLIGRGSALTQLAGPLLQQIVHTPTAVFAIAYRLATMLGIRTMATAFGNMFLVAAAATVALVPLVYLMRPSTPPAQAHTTTDILDADAHKRMHDSYTDSHADVAEESDLPQPRPVSAPADVAGLAWIGRRRAPAGKHRASSPVGVRAALRQMVTPPVSPTTRTRPPGRGNHRAAQRCEGAAVGQACGTTSWRHGEAELSPSLVGEASDEVVEVPTRGAVSTRPVHVLDPAGRGRRP